MEAISHAGTAAGVLTKEGIILIGVQLATNPLLEPTNEKIFKINSQAACAVAGITSDATNLLDLARKRSLNHTLDFDQEIPLEHLVSTFCDTKQHYTQVGGQRPFGVSFLFGGWDEHYGYQLYLTGPAGNYGGWKATAIGKNSRSSLACLRQDYTDTLTLEEGKVLALKAIAKSLDTASLNADIIEMMTLTRDVNRRPGQQIVQTVLEKEEIKNLIEVHKEELVKKDDEDDEEN
ncbi:putative Proteasome subunit alpha type-4-2 [Blattamonas nauphoetae]|uniref:Proteasome subunit alpha type-4-2 n=1 Tax=Blattamonas nauphoetae TaxID=2049346 RepID=A0ABQ9Y4T9_9EUKA|nr:putative Proteasome subunit alpha type-4-2 [Blattamonas nauphoetae]